MIQRTFFLILILFLSCCNTNQNVVGTYRSNFANHGFFVTEIKIKKDSSAEYESGGDMMYEKSTGKFKIFKNHLYVTFDKLKFNDSLFNSFPIDTVLEQEFYENMHHYDLQKENGISYHLKYKIKNNKLFSYHSSGKMIRYGKKHGHKKKLYLRKID